MWPSRRQPRARWLCDEAVNLKMARFPIRIPACFEGLFDSHLATGREVHFLIQRPENIAVDRGPNPHVSLQVPCDNFPSLPWTDHSPHVLCIHFDPPEPPKPDGDIFNGDKHRPKQPTACQSGPGRCRTDSPYPQIWTGNRDQDPVRWIRSVHLLFADERPHYPSHGQAKTRPP